MLVEHLLQGSPKRRRCFSKASPAEGSACSNTPASWRLSVPAGPAIVAKDGDEGPSPSGCGGAAGPGPGPAGSHPPLPTARPFPAPAAGLLSAGTPEGAGRPPIWRTSLQKKASQPPPSAAAGPGPWAEQETAGAGEGHSPMAVC